ncbi:alpha/beta hydrolase family protein [Pseudomonas citri]|uniref:alpha/beta hydrolase family protein n=1 Tax=Pseudomonas citri TaxID=2978349 RepID=UPI0021B55FC3|nr:prolyl oligopeptidase family serine peptidase [Pseudomonas citri]
MINKFFWTLAVSAILTQPAYAADFQTLSTTDGVEYGYQQGLKGKPILVVITTDIAESLSDKYSDTSITLRNAGYTLIAIDATCHGKDTKNKEPSGLACWNKRANDSGTDIFLPYIAKLRSVITTVKDKGIADASTIGVLGVSRGGYLAMRVASEIPEVTTVIALAPVTDIFRLSEFRESKAPRELYSLKANYSTLAKKHIFIQINNDDDRVGTAEALSLITGVTKSENSESVDLMAVLTPRKGHSTSEHQMAAAWALDRQREAAGVGTQMSAPK